MDFWFRLPIQKRLGIIATILLIIAVISVALWTNDPVHYRPIAAIIRFSPILFLFWLAWSDLRRIPFWVWLVMPVVLILCAFKPALWFIVIPVAIFSLFIMPKKKKKK
ncbi:MAG: hypothetical protein LBK82_10020 [Planctomycetaceae bacterium]|jgi:hypothetical protein|nr:hypothetical protein [Planctomycetaceae bacterium]